MVSCPKMGVDVTNMSLFVPVTHPQTKLVSTSLKSSALAGWHGNFDFMGAIDCNCGAISIRCPVGSLGAVTRNLMIHCITENSDLPR